MRKKKFAFFVIVFIIFYVSLTSVIFALTPDGDVAPLGNRDGKIEVGDALVCLRFALGLESPTQDDLEHGDVAPLDSKGQPNPDGALTVGDALVILRMALGLIHCTFEGNWSGKDISFIVSGDPPSVTDICLTYNSVNTYKYSYQPGLPIKNNVFSGKDESFITGDRFEIRGKFLDVANAEVKFDWIGFNPEHSGSQKYTATHQ